MENRRLYSPSYLREIINKYDFKFSKSLGQNFLVDGNIVRNIVKGGEIGKEDQVLEIGPGIGTLTEELALNGKKIIAIELDKSLIPILEENLASHNNVKIIHGDILQVDIRKIIAEEFEGGPIKVVANLPYYVTTPIIGKLLEEDLPIETMVFMVQKEVADRMAAGPGTKDYSSLSLFVNFYSKPQLILRAPKSVFMPQPKIDSAVVRLDIKKGLEDVDREKFFKLVRAGFSKRRKTILNALSSYGFDLNKDEVRQVLEAASIEASKRAEDLSLEDFVRLSQKFPL